jgi:hypothetical protein
MRTKMKRATLASILVAALAAPGCGDGSMIAGGGNRPVPMGNLTVCLGFSDNSIIMHNSCPAAAAGSDGFCHATLTSSDTSILTLSQQFVDVPANSTQDIPIDTIGLRTGTVQIIQVDLVNNIRSVVATVTVVPC